jgi:hypothetical protein
MRCNYVLVDCGVRAVCKAWVCGRRRHECLSLASVVCRQVEVCVGLITRPEEYYRVWCVWVWLGSLNTEEALAHWRLLRYGKIRLSSVTPSSPVFYTDFNHVSYRPGYRTAFACCTADCENNELNFLTSRFYSTVFFLLVKEIFILVYVLLIYACLACAM